MDAEKILMLTQKAKQIRRTILQMIYEIKSGHLGGSLSIVEVLLVLYYEELRINPKNPNWDERDRFILSKGHCAPALYAVLSDRGYFDQELLLHSFRRINSVLQGHPDMNKTPGVDMTSGSLGIGLSAGCGMAYGSRLQKKNYRVYVLLGDGELNEGQVWEAAKTAAHYRLSNLVAMADLNGYQNDGATESEMSMQPIDEKWRAFGWEVVIADGNDIEQVADALDAVSGERPTMILFHTQKGKGVSFMEQDPVTYHSKCPTEKDFFAAISELS